MHLALYQGEGVASYLEDYYVSLTVRNQGDYPHSLYQAPQKEGFGTPYGIVQRASYFSLTSILGRRPA